VGTFVGGITSVATSWLGQQRQTKEQRKAREKQALQELYKQFIENASRLYLDALEHNTTESQSPSTFIPRSIGCVLSSPKLVAAADSALRVIVGVYANENATFSGIRQTIGHGFLDPLRPFSEACHEELEDH
jgi:hypothetical protein